MINAGGTTVTITNYTGSGGAIAIPSNINGLTVTAIGTNAFFEIQSLTSVMIPGSITTIGAYAFIECAYLTSVGLTNGLTSIGELAFENCASLTNVTIPSSVTNIAYQAFYYSGLISVTIPANVTNIAEYAFPSGNLTSATVPGNYSEFYTFNEAFGGDAKLANLTIANGVTSIGNDTFADLASLANVTIPSGVTNIGAYAFDECYNMTNLALSYGLTTIGSNAFNDCTRLKNVTIPASVTSIGTYAFAEEGSLFSYFFADNAPNALSPVFIGTGTVYYLPGTTGWSNTYAGNPTALWNPQIQVGGTGFGVQNNRFGFNITGTANIPIVVEACTNLASPVWTPLKSLTLTNGLVYFSETLQTNSSGRFYRISAP